ncbi:hypothetical protein BJ508DRAFT_349455 [Ascobolus immersus RN42]|uniref:F-box domain-containing protein n=1 Tax=Ascobolus immersus RN42 TaxID=1160509 RepID=A0A3N4HWK4_ASCIM|nr:hypothetical protein BJ508DRAFT_349455 [Ascobolus immersus RN42]
MITGGIFVASSSRLSFRYSIQYIRLFTSAQAPPTSTTNHLRHHCQIVIPKAVLQSIDQSKTPSDFSPSPPQQSRPVRMERRTFLTLPTELRLMIYSFSPALTLLQLQATCVHIRREIFSPIGEVIVENSYGYRQLSLATAGHLSIRNISFVDPAEAEFFFTFCIERARRSKHIPELRELLDGDESTVLLQPAEITYVRKEFRERPPFPAFGRWFLVPNMFHPTAKSLRFLCRRCLRAKRKADFWVQCCLKSSGFSALLEGICHRCFSNLTITEQLKLMLRMNAVMDWFRPPSTPTIGENLTLTSLPFDLRLEIYQHCPAFTLLQLASTSAQIRYEITELRLFTAARHYKDYYVHYDGLGWVPEDFSFRIDGIIGLDREEVDLFIAKYHTEKRVFSFGKTHAGRYFIQATTIRLLCDICLRTRAKDFEIDCWSTIAAKEVLRREKYWCCLDNHVGEMKEEAWLDYLVRHGLEWLVC